MINSRLVEQRRQQQRQQRSGGSLGQYTKVALCSVLLLLVFSCETLQIVESTILRSAVQLSDFNKPLDDLIESEVFEEHEGQILQEFYVYVAVDDTQETATNYVDDDVMFVAPNGPVTSDRVGDDGAPVRLAAGPARSSMDTTTLTSAHLRVPHRNTTATSLPQRPSMNSTTTTTASKTSTGASRQASARARPIRHVHCVGRQDLGQYGGYVSWPAAGAESPSTSSSSSSTQSANVIVAAEWLCKGYFVAHVPTDLDPKPSSL